MIYTAWGTAGVAYIMVPGEGKAVGAEPEDEVVWSTEAESWEEACVRYHEFQGWEPYVPMENDQ